ncbi:MAG: Mpv17/PMP22 family protein [Bacteroidota bacterium]|nr:Mpv17/PMP22 family protein [Bacteroidota bacterium]
MKKQDLAFIILLLAFFAPFFFSEKLYLFYKEFNDEHGLVTAFIKFFFLATLGESLGLRIREGVYNKKGFGLLPRAVVWGFLGISIKIAFVVFSSGTISFLEYVGMDSPQELIKGGLNGKKILIASSISTILNLFYAPVLMTVHKITDAHINMNHGTLKGLFKPIRFTSILQNMDWDVHWNFVLKKTIPLFWIPAQTITFLLPEEWQILFAAVLGIVLGAILAFASLKPSSSID